jgi:uncharacterized Rossmann fold enzyme
MADAMEYAEWEQYYTAIINDLCYDRAQDEEAAGVLSELVEGREQATDEELREALFGAHAFIFANGPDLERGLDRKEFLGTLIAADGATSGLMARGVVPHIIVTDLDGRVEDQLAASAKGAMTVVLAHGDNIPALREWVPKFRGKLVATSQSPPIKNLRSFGGFTDGDRAVFIADHFRAREITLVGFGADEDERFPPEGEGGDPVRKRMNLRKLTWCNVLIAMLDNPVIEFQKN